MNLIEGFKKNRIIGVLLIVSLALNLLFIGAIAGRVMMRPPPRPLPSNLEWLVHALPDETRQKFRTEMVEHRQEIRQLRRDMFKAQRRFNQALADEELDEANLRDSLKGIRNATSRFHEATHEQMIPILIELDAEDRQKALAGLKMNRRRSPHPPRNHYPHGDSDN